MRKGNATHPPLNKYLIKEYEQYVREMFGNDVKVSGPPLSLKDPRPEMKSCLEKTIRKKISKMTWMHIYFSVSRREGSDDTVTPIFRRTESSNIPVPSPTAGRILSASSVALLVSVWDSAC